ncbi:unnamed protein product, partial [Gulo gulo]
PPEVRRAAPAGGGERAARESTLDSAPLRVCALLPAGRSAPLCLSMEGARSPSPGEDLELLALGGQPDEQKPLNGTVQVIPLSVEEPCPAQAKEENPWSSCNKKLIGKCKLWMVIASVFLGLIIVIIISLCLLGVTYIDEDANEILELSSNKTFLVVLKIPEECNAEEEWPHLLMERVIIS